MDWNLIKEKYPKASNKLKDWACGEESFILEADPRCLYDFFDENGIYVVIELEYEYTYDEKIYSDAWYYKIIEGNGWTGVEGTELKTRTEAEKQAFMKAFEILENKHKLINLSESSEENLGKIVKEGFKIIKDLKEK